MHFEDAWHRPTPPRHLVQPSSTDAYVSEGSLREGELEFNDKRRCGPVKDAQSTQRMWASLCRGRVQHGADKGICWTSTAGVGAFFHVPRVLLLFVVLDGYAQRTAYCPAWTSDGAGAEEEARGLGGGRRAGGQEGKRRERNTAKACSGMRARSSQHLQPRTLDTVATVSAIHTHAQHRSAAGVVQYAHHVRLFIHTPPSQTHARMRTRARTHRTHRTNHTRDRPTEIEIETEERLG